jgi:hypothetical protein
MSLNKTWRTVAMGGAPAWSPLDDAATLLMLPGGYSITGTKGVDASGTWLDESGNGHHAVQAVDALCPVPHASAWPIFNAANTEFLQTNASLDDITWPANAITSPDNGAIVVIGKTTLLAAYAPNYGNAAFITGEGATPGIYLDDAGGRITGYNDGAVYEDAIRAGGVAADTPIVVAGKWDSIGIYASRAGAAWSAVTPYAAGASLSVGNIGQNTWIGRSFSTYLGGDVRAVGIYATLAQWQAWAVAQGLV